MNPISAVAAAAKLRGRAAREGNIIETWLMAPWTYMIVAAGRTDAAPDGLRLFGIPVEINHAPDAPDLIAKTALGELVGEPLGELADSVFPGSGKNGR